MPDRQPAPPHPSGDSIRRDDGPGQVPGDGDAQLDVPPQAETPSAPHLPPAPPDVRNDR